MRLDGAKKWYALTALATVVVLLAGWFLLVSPQRQSADDISAQADNQVSQNQATQTKINALKLQYANLPTLQKQLAVVQTHIPETPALASLLRNLNAAAVSSGVKLLSVTPTAPAPLAGQPAATKPGATTGPVPGQVESIGVTLQITGPFANTRLFLTSLESMPRAFLVTGLAISRANATAAGTSVGNVLQTTVNGKVFTVTPGATSAAVASTTSGSAPSTATNG